MRWGESVRSTISGLQQTLDQAEKRVTATRTDLTGTQAQRDTLSGSLNQWKERHTAAKNLTLAQTSAE